MDGRLEESPILLLEGMGFYGDPFSKSAGWTEDNEIGLLWKRFMRYISVSTGKTTLYEVHIFDEESLKTGLYEVFVGRPIGELSDVPVNLSVKILPKTRYAWFTLVGEAIANEDGYRAMDAWIAGKGLVRNGSWFCNVYDERFKGMERLTESTIDVCLPVI